MSCTLDKFPEMTEGFMIAYLNGYTFIIALVLFASFLGFSIFLYIFYRNKNEGINSKEHSLLETEDKEKDFNFIQKMLRKFFRMLGISELFLC